MITRRALAILAISLAFLASVSLAQPAFAAVGRLDPTFETGGTDLTNLGPPGVQIQPGADDAALQPNGDIAGGPLGGQDLAGEAALTDQRHGHLGSWLPVSVDRVILCR